MAEDLSPSIPPSPAALPPWHQAALAWCKANPLAAALSLGLALTIGVFYAAVHLFTHEPTVFSWAWNAYNPETRYEHAKLVPFIILFLIWNDLPRLRAARIQPSNWGLAPLIFGIVLYLLSARTLQPRVSLAALPCLCLGISLYVGGRQFTRAILFPICCLFFLVPLPGIDQATVQLQLLVAKAATVLCGFIGISLINVGATVRAVDQSFQFDIAGGCSGINSLMAITLMTAIFAHLSQDRIWKKLLLFTASMPVAVIGNIARIVAIMVVAKCFGQDIAGGWFHDISSYLVSFPFAFGSLCLVHTIINWNVPKAPRPPGPPKPPAARPDADAEPMFAPGVHPTPAKAASYDY